MPMPQSPTSTFLTTARYGSRLDVLTEILKARSPKSMLEIGVWKGDLSEHLLANVPSLQTYHLLDPWQNLENWNKPFNTNSLDFQAIYEGCMLRLAPWAEKLVVHRCKTSEFPAESVPQFDAIYIDGDHTLRGIVIDLTTATRVLSADGIILCDDYTPGTLFQHGLSYEPSLVYPYCDYFCEAHNWECVDLPFSQLLINPSNPFDTNRARPELLPLLAEFVRVEKSLPAGRKVFSQTLSRIAAQLRSCLAPLR